MNKNIIYIEEQIKDHANTKKILAHFAGAHLVYIKHYKDVFNQANSEWRAQKASQKIILAKRTNHFYYKGSGVTPSFGYKHFYYNTLALNCIYDCEYCYLQGLFPSAHLVLFVNNDDFIEATKELIAQLNAPVYFALSYDTDLLAIEHWYAYCQEWLAFATNEKNLVIEIRTKSNNIKAISHLPPTENAILAWTVSPADIAKQHEPQTPPTSSRIQAIKKAIALGWRVRICIDPILLVNNWQQHYTELVNELAIALPLEKIDSFSLGVFRMNKHFLKNIQHQRSDTAIIYNKFELENDVYTYNKSTINSMYELITQKILEHCPTASIEIQ